MVILLFLYRKIIEELLGLNFEYNWHSQQGLHFFPAYLSFQYSLNKNIENSAFFARFGYGTLLGISTDFEKGNIEIPKQQGPIKKERQKKENKPTSLQSQLYQRCQES